MRKLKNSELNRKTEEDYKNSVKNRVTVVLDNIRSLNNIGSVFRTADAFLIEQIYLCGITATPPHNDIRKTALGAENSVSWKYFENTKDAVLELINQEYLIFSVEQVENSLKLQEIPVSPNKKYALVFGNEVKGVSQEVIDISHKCIEIPQEGTKHSINISVCAGIVIWEFYKKLNGFSCEV